MSTDHTPNYSLFQWEADDKVLRTDFNEDNRKIDAALAGKASASALSSLQTTVSGKASQSALNALSATLEQHASTLNTKGNCQIFIATYTGKGTYGAENLNSVTFPMKPEIVFVSAPTGMQAVFIRDQELTYASNGGSGFPLAVTWTGNSVKWYNHTSAAGQLNMASTAYLAVALARAS